MNRYKIERIKREAARFLDAVQELEQKGHLSDGYGCPKFYYPGKYTGAVRRASMDLTRALAKLRRG